MPHDAADTQFRDESIEYFLAHRGEIQARADRSRRLMMPVECVVFFLVGLYVVLVLMNQARIVQH